MKIRIKGNSVRYRLTRSEVEAFGKNGYLEERTEFPGNTLIYALKAKSGIENLEADMKENTIVLYLPESEKEIWFDSERVGYKNKMSLHNGKELFLLLEKDFVCLDDVEEDQSDNYPNPNANS